MNQLKENLIWIALGIPGMVLIGLVLHSLVHFETGVLVITSMILRNLCLHRDQGPEGPCTRYDPG